MIELFTAFNANFIPQLFFIISLELVTTISEPRTLKH